MRSPFDRPLVLALAVAAAAAAAAPSLHAQGTLGTQGFGYPPGQISTRSLGTGGAVGELDPASALNPAALINWGGSALFFQIEPERRRISAPGGNESTLTARFPLTSALMQIGQRWAVGLSASTLLDRSWTTTTRARQLIGQDTVFSTVTHRSSGAINDIRLGGAFLANDWIRLGAGLHALTGRNQLGILSRFDDTVRFGLVGDTTTISYHGNALSAGVEIRAGTALSIAASGRLGGRLSASRGDSTLVSGDAPNRYGVSVTYLGIPNSAIGVRYGMDQWSSFASLGSAAVRAVDATDLSVGADIAGPRLGQNRSLMLRAGARWRTLPFAVGPDEVRERSVSVGAGTLFARNRAGLDLALVRAARDAGIDVKESAWIFSVGFSVRP